jgi:hypothetical protein
MSKTVVLASALFLGAAAFGLSAEPALAASAKRADALKKAECGAQSNAATLHRRAKKQVGQAMCGRQRAVPRQAYGVSAAPSHSNAERHAVRWWHGQHSTQQRAGRAEHAGGRLQRHIDQRVQCDVHKRVEQQQYRQLQTIDFQERTPNLECPLLALGVNVCFREQGGHRMRRVCPTFSYGNTGGQISVNDDARRRRRHGENSSHPPTPEDAAPTYRARKAFPAHVHLRQREDA